MPVRKYRRVEDMPEPWQIYGDSHVGERLRVVAGLARLAGPLAFPRGVRKFRSIEELIDDREAREDERIARIQQRNRMTK